MPLSQIQKNKDMPLSQKKSTIERENMQKNDEEKRVSWPQQKIWLSA